MQRNKIAKSHKYAPITSKLPVRVDNKLWLEPYYPNRFTRQFGFDQGVPSDKLSFGNAKRSHCIVEDFFRAQTSLLRRNTSVLFYILRSTRMGQCTYWYCRWWMGYTTSYLGPERAKATKDVVLDNSNFETNSGILNPSNDNIVAQELARHVYIIGEVQGIFDKLHSSKSSKEMLAHHEGMKSVFNVLRSMLDILDFGKTELEWFVNTIDQIFCCVLQISENTRIVEQGTWVRDLIRRHDDCLNSKRVVDSDLPNFTQELEDLDAQEFVVKEVEERVRMLREQHDSGKLSLNCHIKDAKTSMRKQNKLDEELRQSRIGEKELLEIEHIKASCKSQEAEIQTLIDSLVSFCNKS
ncbi:unnamed protein product [Prunus armeniaca]